ncbi:hypothetical protein ACIP4Y_35110 [Streptomyces sp. NPDC088810]|uniref:hypothetical protein n=1 Tax=Streptomyces sp. NPDC088810 TaxID=3365904 RepID=UPI00380C47DB
MTVPTDTGSQFVREAARRIVDLVLTEDDVYLDSLPDEVEASIAVPLIEVARMLDEPAGNKEFRGGVPAALRTARTRRVPRRTTSCRRRTTGPSGSTLAAAGSDIPP